MEKDAKKSKRERKEERQMKQNKKSKKQKAAEGEVEEPGPNTKKSKKRKHEETENENENECADKENEDATDKKSKKKKTEGSVVEERITENGVNDKKSKKKKKQKSDETDDSYKITNGDLNCSAISNGVHDNSMTNGNHDCSNISTIRLNDTLEINHSPFKWKNVIKKTLKDAPDYTLKRKKLRKLVFAQYYESNNGGNAMSESELHVIFKKKLINEKFLVQKDHVRLKKDC